MDGMGSALIVIDMQNGFLEPESPLCIAQAKATVPACARAIGQAREWGLPVIFVTRIYREDGSDVELGRKAVWEAGGRPLSPGSTGPLSPEMPEAFGEGPGDYHIVKPRFSAFFQTPLDLLLRRLKIARVCLIGTTTPNCIRTTCYDALSLDYQVLILSDGCSSNTDAIQQANLEDMGRVGAVITTTGHWQEFILS